MSDFLEKILAHKKKLVKQKESYYQSLRTNLKKGQATSYRIFKQRISKPGKMNLIAEIKKASPSKGMIRPDWDLSGIVKVYEESNVDAVSVLTEDKFFLGKPEYIKIVASGMNVPLLAKDFIIDEGQIYEARFNGASAVLLIAAVLDEATLKEFLKISHDSDIDCLVEVHDEEELDGALCAGADIVGINNRNLKSFDVDLEVSRRLVPRIPSEKVIVAESGIKTHEDILMLQDLGVNAVLIGESFMREEDIGEKIKEVMGKDWN